MLYLVQLSIYRKVILSVLALLVISQILAGCSGRKVPGSDTANSQRIAADKTSPEAVQEPLPDRVVSNSDRLLIPKVTVPALTLPIPAAIRRNTESNRLVPAPQVTPAHLALYTVVADKVPIKEILHAIARDATAKVDVVGEIEGDISLSMINQPLDVILREITRQLPVRYVLRGNTIVLTQDKPVIRHYQVDYLNIRRTSESRVDLATQVGSMRVNIDGAAGSQGGGSNGSRLFVENTSDNNFWTSLVRSIAGILGEKTDAEGNGAANILVNRESGILTVRATDFQHQSIDKLLSEVVNSVQRQVLIEATVVEVTLGDRFESGVDWSVLNSGQSGSESGGTFDYSQVFDGLPQAADALAPVTALLSYNHANSVIGNLSATLKLLQQFGDVQVLSSPKIIAMNNQPAVLKVVDNRVYFTFEVDRMQRENGDERTVVDSTVHSVPVGLVMSVTPFINQLDEVILNVRPTISRILNFAEDPSPALAGQSQIRNLIPEIQVREMESLLRVQSGDVAIIGGLMQNKIDNRSTDVPGVSRLPILGRLFSHNKRSVEKTELLVFLRPTVMKRKPAVINKNSEQMPQTHRHFDSDNPMVAGRNRYLPSISDE